MLYIKSLLATDAGAAWANDTTLHSLVDTVYTVTWPICVAKQFMNVVQLWHSMDQIAALDSPAAAKSASAPAKSSKASKATKRKTSKKRSKKKSSKKSKK
jgi:hypothetical protein